MDAFDTKKYRERYSAQEDCIAVDVFSLCDMIDLLKLAFRKSVENSENVYWTEIEEAMENYVFQAQAETKA